MSRVTHIVTPEYPPQPGGVSDFTRVLAEGLADRGHEVHVWCPTAAAGTGKANVHSTLAGLNAAAFARTGGELDGFPPPRRVLVQWVPHAYGWRAMNLPFCRWVASRARRGDRIELLVHEPFLMFREKPQYWPVAAVQRVMLALLLQAATRVWCAIAMWETLLRPYAPRATEFRPMPAVSTVPTGSTPPTAAWTFGHFSQFARSTADPLRTLLPALARAVPSARVRLIGRNAAAFREEMIRAGVNDQQVSASGPLSLAQVADELSACEVLLQPVSGGVSSRNTSVLAGLANGRPLLTTRGWLTESFWAESGAVALAADGDAAGLTKLAAELAGDPTARAALSDRAMELFDARFHPRHLIDAFA